MRTLNTQSTAANDHDIFNGFEDITYDSIQSTIPKPELSGVHMKKATYKQPNQNIETEHWKLLGYEIVLRESKPGLLLQCKKTHEVIKISPDAAKHVDFGSEITYISGWLAGVLEALSGQITWLNLQETFENLKNK